MPSLYMDEKNVRDNLGLPGPVTARARAEAAEDLRDASTAINELGWVQNSMRTDRGVCALGGLVVATGYNGSVQTREARRYYNASVVLRDYLAATGHEFGLADAFGAIPLWNDEYATTKTEVTAGLEKAAAWIEEQA